MGESERQVRDAAVVLEKCGHKLDLPYIEKWVQALGLAAQFSQARQLADLA
jgi:hypothetical protein